MRVLDARLGQEIRGAIIIQTMWKRLGLSGGRYLSISAQDAGCVDAIIVPCGPVRSVSHSPFRSKRATKRALLTSVNGRGFRIRAIAGK